MELISVRCGDLFFFSMLLDKSTENVPLKEAPYKAISYIHRNRNGEYDEGRLERT